MSRFKKYRQEIKSYPSAYADYLTKESKTKETKKGINVRGCSYRIPGQGSPTKEEVEVSLF